METPSNSRNLNDEVIASLNKIAEVKKDRAAIGMQ